MKLKILVYENDKKDLKNLQECIHSFFSTMMMEYTLNICPNMRYIQENIHQFDFLFLDMKLDDVDGIDVGMEVRRRNGACHIVITSRYKGYLIDGYKMHADRFFVKPISQAYFNAEMSALIQTDLTDFLSFQDDRISDQRIYYKDILYIDFYSKRAYLIHRELGRLKTPYPLHYWVDQLWSIGFVQCYKSILVNCRFVQEFKKDTVYLDNGETLPVSRKYKKQFKERWIECLQKRI